MMMKNYDESVNITHNSNWLYIPDHLYRILITADARSGKTNASLTIMKHQRPVVEKIYLYVKDPFESKYQLLINKRKKQGLKILKIKKHLLVIHQQLMMRMVIYKTMIQQRK